MKKIRVTPLDVSVVLKWSDTELVTHYKCKLCDNWIFIIRRQHVIRTVTCCECRWIDPNPRSAKNVSDFLNGLPDGSERREALRVFGFVLKDGKPLLPSRRPDNGLGEASDPLRWLTETVGEPITRKPATR